LDSPVSSASPELNKMLEGDTASGVARKGDGNKEWRVVMKTKV
jgi:hypothetical protein